MKSVLVALLVLSSTGAIAATTCKISAGKNSGPVERDLGSFELSERGGAEFGALTVKSYNAGYGKYAEKTAAFELEVGRNDARAPYEVKMWLLTNDRGAESVVSFKVPSLPIEAEMNLFVNQKSNPVAAESAGTVVIRCN